MISSNCPRCKSDFHSTVKREKIDCPYCGYAFSNEAQVRRMDERTMVQSDCKLLLGGAWREAKTIDISASGLGVKIMWPELLKVGKSIRVKVDDFSIDANADIVWSDSFGGVMTKVGLRTLQQQPA